MPYNDSHIINYIRIVHLTNDHDLESFCCGNNEIDHFLKDSAIYHSNMLSIEQEEMLSMAYLTCFDGEVIGFFTLAASSIEVLAVDTVNGIEEFPESVYPAIDIPKLAITKKFQGK